MEDTYYRCSTCGFWSFNMPGLRKHLERHAGHVEAEPLTQEQRFGNVGGKRERKKTSVFSSFQDFEEGSDGTKRKRRRKKRKKMLRWYHFFPALSAADVAKYHCTEGVDW